MPTLSPDAIVALRVVQRFKQFASLVADDGPLSDDGESSAFWTDAAWLADRITTILPQLNPNPIIKLATLDPGKPMSRARRWALANRAVLLVDLLESAILRAERTESAGRSVGRLPSVGSDGRTEAAAVHQAPPPKGEPAAAEPDGSPWEIRQAAGPSDSRSKAGKPVLTPGGRVLAAAYELQKEGKAISLRAACERAGDVDRAHLRKKYPEAVDAVRRMATPDRTPRRGARNRRTEDIDAVDDSED